MNRNYNTIKATIIFLSILFFILLAIFTIDVINDVPNWAWMQIDFDSSKVANYGTLISGLLSFLAILFVIFGIAEQKEQIDRDKMIKQDELNENYKNRLKLMISLLIKITDEIKEQGKRMKTYYQLELEHPTQPNITYFSANKSFNRILEMDYLTNYQAIQHFFQKEDNWEKMFLNLNSNVDFYSEALIEHRQKYQNHIKDKVKRHKEISDLCSGFLNDSVRIIEKYRLIYGTSEYLNQKWAIEYNNFIPSYYEYLEHCRSNQEATNFRLLSNDFFLKFLENAMELRNEIGFDTLGSEDQVALASKIRKKIYEVEMYSIQYAENIKYYYDEYFDENCQSFKDLNTITDKISAKLKSSIL